MGLRRRRTAGSAAAGRLQQVRQHVTGQSLVRRIYNLNAVFYVPFFLHSAFKRREEISQIEIFNPNFKKKKVILSEL